MRGRSSLFQSTDPHDDWVDGSWTVDCVCGITFDDGEEMVNCDECGVWVHTRCSKYVKGEESFACYKCKNKNKRNSSNNDSEETEVAQLLVELPTKTVRLESSCSGTARKPIWTNIPMENRVHVQGIPGGDPSLFNGFSSVFTPELWKCTGHVPKKLNFQYKEFPCWDEKEVGDKKEEQNENDMQNAVDKGAGVLFSLSKESVLGTTVADLVGLRGRDGEAGFERKVCSKEMKKWDCEGINVRFSRNGMKKERSLLRPVVIHSGKRNKEDLETSEDRSGNKKFGASEKEAEDRKKNVLGSRTVFRPSSDAKQLEFYEDRDPKSSKTDIQNKKKNFQEDMHQEPISYAHPSVDSGDDKPKNNLAANERPLDAFSHDASGPNLSVVEGLEQEMDGHQMPATTKSSTTDDVSVSMSEQNDARSIPVKQEGENLAGDKLDDGMKASAKSFGKLLAEDVASAAIKLVDNQIPKDSGGDMSRTSVLPDVELKTEVDKKNNGGHLNVQSSPIDLKVQSKSCDEMAKTSKLNEFVASSLQLNDHMIQDAKRTSEAVTDCRSVDVHEVTGDPCLIKHEQEGSNGSADQNNSFEFKQSAIAKEHLKSEGTILNSTALTSLRKMVVCVGKSSSSSSNIVASEFSVSENVKSADAWNSCLNSKQKLRSDGKASIKKDLDVSDVARDEEKHDKLRKTVKGHSKSSGNSVSKMSHSSRISHAPVSKRTMSDAKDFVSSSSSSVQNIAVTSGTGEFAGSLQSKCILQTQNKMSTSTLPPKGEKLNQSNFQPQPKMNHAPLMHPPAASNFPATLSDEELALLLHQELNSSPRVPRVPRVRHTGSLPQLSSPTSTSMLIKRASSSGGKDHSLVSRRKNKDVSRDGLRSRELDDESRKKDRVSSPDLRRQNVRHAADVYTKREDNGSPTEVHSLKKNVLSASATSANSGPSSSAEVNDHNASSLRNSPRNISDDDTGTNKGPVHHTLCDLIEEFLSKDHQMTYEELCDAVLPHWPHLRKQNGERYAYSSHSQAVLDCLQNRPEWVQLVDRGPKTSSRRKRRKLDGDKSEDNEYGSVGTARELENKGLESQTDDFPKGKRKARKRRRLALQGRGIKDVRKIRKVDLPSDHDGSLFSNSSEESMFNDDETHQSEECPAGSEATASSDEMGTS